MAAALPLHASLGLRRQPQRPELGHFCAVGFLPRLIVVGRGLAFTLVLFFAPEQRLSVGLRCRIGVPVTVRSHVRFPFAARAAFILGNLSCASAKRV